MNGIVKIENIKELIIDIRNEKVLLDADVAVIYGVETKRINEAVKNNPDRFPSGCFIELSNNDKNELVENFDRLNRLKHSSTPPRAFTEKGLYMLASVLKSQQASQATLSIIETFSKIRELFKSIKKSKFLTSIKESIQFHGVRLDQIII